MQVNNDEMAFNFDEGLSPHKVFQFLFASQPKELFHQPLLESNDKASKLIFLRQKGWKHLWLP